MKHTTLFAIIAALTTPLIGHTEGFYVGGNIGRAEQKANLPAVLINKSSTAYKLVGGYNYSENFGTEVGYSELHKVSAPVGEAIYNSRPSALYIAATGTLPLSDQFSVFGKLGVAYAHEQLSTNYNGAYGNTYGSASDNRTTPYLGVGASFTLNQRVNLVAEYENFGKVAKSGPLSVKADMVSLGIRYKF